MSEMNNMQNMSSTKQDILLKCSNIRTLMDNVLIHNGVDLTVKRGEIISLMGGSGSGKTTFANVLLGFVKIQSGSIIFDNVDISTHQIIDRNKIGFQPQNNALLADKTIIENVALPLRYITNLDWEVCLQLAYHKIALVNLSENDCYKYPHMCSGGMLKKASLARAIATDPDLLILDEPLSGLDHINADKIENLIWELSKEISIICITHNIIKSDKYYILKDKKIIELNENKAREICYV